MSRKIFYNSAKLLLGHALGQGIIFLTGPILSRIYTPEQFGSFTLLSSIAGILSILSTGGYEFAIATVRKDNEAKTISFLAILLCLITSTISALLLFILFFSSYSWQTNITGTGWILIPVLVLLQGIYNTAGFIMNRKEEYSLLSISRTSRSLVMVPAQLILGIKSYGGGLFSGMVIGQSFSTLLLLSQTFRQRWLSPYNLQFRDILKQFKKHIKFPLFLMPQEVINGFSSQLPIFVLSYFFSQTAVGLYALPHKFLSAPIFLIGNSLGRIYLRDASLSLKDDDLKQTTLKLFRFLFRLGLLPFSILLIFGDKIFSTVFGLQWDESGTFAMILSPWLLFVLTGSSLSNIFTAKGRQKQGFKINLYLLMARIFSLVPGVFFFSSTLVTIAVFSATSFVFWVYITFYNLYLAKIKIIPIIIETFSIWFLCLLLLGLLRFYIL